VLLTSPLHLVRVPERAMSANPGEPMLQIPVSTEEVPGKGWVAYASGVRATAQGATAVEAVENLAALIKQYPDLLDALLAEVRKEPARHLDLTLTPA
jgi:hypothetical protein